MALRIALISEEDTRSRDTLSGIPYNLANALERSGATVFRLGPCKHSAPNWISGALSNFHRWRGRKYFHVWTTRESRRIGDEFSRKINECEADCVLSIIFSPAAYLRTDLPIFLWTDSTFRLLEEGYPIFQNLAPKCRTALLKQEHRALLGARQTFCTSNWVANAIQADHNLASERTKIATIGANHVSGWDEAVVSRKIAKQQMDICELLFIGVEWYRKGGDRALELAAMLNRSGLETRLTIVGTWPPQGIRLPAFARCLGSLAQSDATSRTRMDRLFSSAHFLVLPSRGDCTPIVVAEAMSYGVPAIASAVGGLPEMIEDGKTGYVQKMNTSDELIPICHKVLAAFRVPSLWSEMAIAAFYRHKAFDWSNHAGAIIDEINLAVFDKTPRFPRQE